LDLHSFNWRAVSRTYKEDGQRMSVTLWQLLGESELCPCEPVPRLEKHSKMKVADQKRLPGIPEKVAKTEKHRLKTAWSRTRVEPVLPATNSKMLQIIWGSTELPSKWRGGILSLEIATLKQFEIGYFSHAAIYDIFYIIFIYIYIYKYDILYIGSSRQTSPIFRGRSSRFCRINSNFAQWVRCSADLVRIWFIKRSAEWVRILFFLSGTWFRLREEWSLFEKGTHSAPPNDFFHEKLGNSTLPSRLRAGPVRQGQRREDWGTCLHQQRGGDRMVHILIILCIEYGSYTNLWTNIIWTVRSLSFYLDILWTLRSII